MAMLKNLSGLAEDTAMLRARARAKARRQTPLGPHAVRDYDKGGMRKFIEQIMVDTQGAYIPSANTGYIVATWSLHSSGPRHILA